VIASHISNANVQYKESMKLKISTLLILLGAILTGCRSPYIETDITNNSDAPLRLIEVDYPSASFGKQSLDPHTTYHYHFKIQGSGPITISFTDAAGKAHTATGPELKEGQQGPLTASVDTSGNVAWSQNLTMAR
jgi:hypothetical protein